MLPPKDSSKKLVLQLERSNVVTVFFAVPSLIPHSESTSESTCVYDNNPSKNISPHYFIVLLLQAPRCHQKILREKKTPSGGEGPKPSLNPNRASYPGALVTSATSATSSEAGSVEGNHFS
jgi:hypothetical protein